MDEGLGVGVMGLGDREEGKRDGGRSGEISHA